MREATKNHYKVLISNNFLLPELKYPKDLKRKLKIKIMKTR